MKDVKIEVSVDELDRGLEELDRELSDVLFAISVITKQLAKKINIKLQKEKE